NGSSRCGGRHQLREIHGRIAELVLIDTLAGFDELAPDLVGLRVIDREHRPNQPSADVEDREGQAVLVAAPDCAIAAGRVAAILEAYVVLVGPEVGQPR